MSHIQPQKNLNPRYKLPGWKFPVQENRVRLAMIYKIWLSVHQTLFGLPQTADWAGFLKGSSDTLPVKTVCLMNRFLQWFLQKEGFLQAQNWGHTYHSPQACDCKSGTGRPAEGHCFNWWSWTASASPVAKKDNTGTCSHFSQYTVHTDDPFPPGAQPCGKAGCFYNR